MPYIHCVFLAWNISTLSSLLIQMLWICKTPVKCHLLQVAPSQNYCLYSSWTLNVHHLLHRSDLLHSSIFPQDGQLTENKEHFQFISWPYPPYLSRCPACLGVAKFNPTSSTFTLSRARHHHGHVDVLASWTNVQSSWDERTLQKPQKTQRVDVNAV